MSPEVCYKAHRDSTSVLVNVWMNGWTVQ